MSVEIRFEDPIGTVIGRNLEPGQEVRITGKITGVSFLPEIFTPVTLYIDPTSPSDAFSPYQEGSTTNIAGNYWYDITLPNVVCTATVTVCVHGLLWDECNEVGIGIGKQAPSPAIDWWPILWKFIPIASIGVIAVSSIYLLKGVKKRTIGTTSLLPEIRKPK